MTPNDLVLTKRGVRFMGRYFPCSIGGGGTVVEKREGDAATPVGHHSLTGLLYRPDRLNKPCPWAQPIRPGDLWSDASGQPDYNQMVRRPYSHSHENLVRPDPLYDLILLTDWNWPHAKEGQGSAIFLHQWRRPGYPTQGCIAFSRAHLLWIATRAVPGTRLYVRH